MGINEREQTARQQGVRRTVGRTLAALAGMFAFAFALVPLYDVFCQVTGLNGKTSNRAQALVGEEVDASRVVTVQFVTRGGQGLPWSLESSVNQMRLHPGQREEVVFAFHNLGQQAVMAKAVPSVSPSEAAPALRKLACFCFEQQRLAPGERFEAPLVFQITRDLPERVKTVTLVYTLYPVDEPGVALQERAPFRGGDKA